MKRTERMPTGIKRRDGKRKIAVMLDQQVFDDVCTFALNRGWSFSEAINDLAKCGIFDMKEAEEFTKTTEKPNDSNQPGDTSAETANVS